MFDPGAWYACCIMKSQQGEYPGLRFAVVATAAALMTPATSHGAPAAPESVPGRVTHVTLYRGQAMVTRTIPVPGAKGGKELVVGDLPDLVCAVNGEAVRVQFYLMEGFQEDA